MTVTLAAADDGALFTADASLVTGLDALVYRQATGEDIDGRIGALIASAPEDPADWPLADKAIIKWLWVRATVDANAPLADVASTVHLLPATVAGEPDAPGVD